MVLKIIYWTTAGCYVAGLSLLFLSGAAGARIINTSTLVIAGVLLGAGLLLLGGSMVMFLRSTSPMWRGAAVVMIALPLLVAVSGAAISEVRKHMNTDGAGNIAYFPAGPLRDMGAAISLNDATTVARLAPKVDVNARGDHGKTLLLAAFGQLEKTPDRLEVLRALMKAGADPNLSVDEAPLRIAIRLSKSAGPEPVALLLAAGANPNVKDGFGEPAYFLAAEFADPEVLKMVLDHGADVSAKGYRGSSLLFAAAQARNWKCVLFLLHRGVDWKNDLSPDGQPLAAWITHIGGVESDPRGYQEVLEYMRAN